MIDFACKRFDINNIIKCGLGLTRAELKVMQYFLRHMDFEFTTDALSRKTKLDLTTIQKAVKKLTEKKIISRSQKNLDTGGYVFFYKCNSKQSIRDVLKKIIRNWSENVEMHIDSW